MTTPDYLGGARVITWARSGTKPFGFIPVTGNEENEVVFGLAICKYDNSQEYYRFCCDENWEVLQDAVYNSIEDATQLLPEQYKNVERVWNVVE